MGQEVAEVEAEEAQEGAGKEAGAIRVATAVIMEVAMEAMEVFLFTEENKLSPNSI